MTPVMQARRLPPSDRLRRPAEPGRAEDAGRDLRREASRPKGEPGGPTQRSAARHDPPAARPRPAGPPPAETLPLILEERGGADYALLDSGGGRKLERYGPLLIDRPENQALWARRLAPAVWAGADAVFTGDVDEEGMGRWRFPHEPLGETWPMRFDGMPYLGRFTSFRHVGVFPEQGPHWRHMAGLIERRRRERPGGRPRVLNLFGHTGVASLVAAAAGADVTHIDASKKAIGWARENAAAAGLEAAPIRWICEDAVRFAERELRRGSRYDVVLLDPPAYGRGPKGEVWELYADLPGMVSLCRDLLSDAPLALVLTAYSIRMSFFSLHALVRDAMAGRGGRVESGELVIREEPASGQAGRALSTSLFSRWAAEP